MSQWYGGGYPRGNPPNWDDSQDENQPSTSGGGGGGIFLFMLLFIIVLIFMCVGDVNNKANKSEEYEPRHTITFTTVIPEKPTHTTLKYNLPSIVSPHATQDILVEDDLGKADLIKLIKKISGWPLYDYPVEIRIFTNRSAQEEARLNSYKIPQDYNEESYQKGYLLQYVREEGVSEIQWMQKEGKFSHLYGIVETLTNKNPR